MAIYQTMGLPTSKNCGFPMHPKRCHDSRILNQTCSGHSDGLRNLEGVFCHHPTNKAGWKVALRTRIDSFTIINLLLDNKI